MTDAVDPAMEALRDVFLEEAREHIEYIEQTVLAMQGDNVEIATFDAIFRAAHTVKGGAGACGFKDLSRFTHAIEGILDDLRNEVRAVDGELIQLLLESADVFNGFLTALEAGDVDPPENARPLAKRVKALREGKSTAAPEAQDATAGYIITLKPNVDCLLCLNDPYAVLQQLDALGQLEVEASLDSIPAFADIGSFDLHLSWQIVLRGDIEQATIDETLSWLDGDATWTIEPLCKPTGIPDASNAPELAEPEPVDAEPPPPEATRQNAPSKDKPKTKRKSAALKVDADKIDSVLNLVGELVITQSMLRDRVRRLEQQGTETRLQSPLGRLDQQTRDLQEGVLRMRMVSVRQVLDRVPRMVHDLKRQLNKEVELQILGAETEVDREVIQSLGDPLLHLVRNALDHGIEAPDVRVAAGKPAHGTLRIEARHEGGDVVLRIRDDGKGINPEVMMAKAIEKGILSPGERLSDQAACELVFHAGFSTAAALSDVSGRGVGMDVVRRNVESLGGSVTVTSAIGKGTTFALRLPLTLAILDGQVTAVGDETWIVPMRHVVECMSFDPDLVRRLPGGEQVYPVRGQYLPLHMLRERLRANASGPAPKNTLLLIVEADGRRAAIRVDRLYDPQQIVLKSLQHNYREVDLVAGATLLGDGGIAMVLDVRALIHSENPTARSVAGGTHGGDDDVPHC